MYVMHEELIHEHVQRLHADFAHAHGAQEARRARRRAGVRWSWLRASRPARGLTPVAAVEVAPNAVARTLWRQHLLPVGADSSSPTSQREHVSVM